jgi:uncharacterized protein
MFLIGMTAGRYRLILATPVRTVLIRCVIWIAHLIWLGLGIFLTFGPELFGSFFFKIHWNLRALGWILHAPAGSLFYISAILSLLALRPDWIPKLSPLAAMGRMCLTNYLMQSIIGTTLYYHYGFNLQTKLGVFPGLLLGVTVFALQIPMSVWWLRRFKFGPVEWLWRSLTYMRIQPFKT